MPIRNQAQWDRGLRIAVGALMLIAGIWGGIEGLAGASLRIFGWLPLATGLIGWCPLYAFFGWSTVAFRRNR
jgi:hypothetical protein